ncbi:hypothetical protein ACHAPE_007988 [Trichoderma viride]
MSHPQSTFDNTSFFGETILSRRRNLIASVTLHAQLEQLKQTGRYDCFKLKWHPIYDDKSMWPVPYHLFWDSDVAKWIESACYFLQREYNASIDLAVRELVDMIRGAQQPDGYINVHYTVVEPQKRWSNLRDMHELYNAGHLIEAALAHHKYYRNNHLLDPVLKYVSLIHRTFGGGQGQLHAYPGHPEIEMALLRLYTATKSQEAYELAQYFLQHRGNPSGQHGMHYFDWEAQQRQENPYTRPNTYPEKDSHWYCQAHKPILEQETIEGHSLHHKADKALSNPDAWMEAVSRLWSNMVDKKMYTNACRKFSIAIGGFEPRYISPHPYTSQNVLGIARGPIVYCMEDVDNPWQHNHFRDVALKKSEPISEEARSMANGESYIELRTKCWLTKEDMSARTAGPILDASLGGDKLEKNGVFIPYFLRANRGGNGEMRVLPRREGE